MQQKHPYLIRVFLYVLHEYTRTETIAVMKKTFSLFVVIFYFLPRFPLRVRITLQTDP